MILSSFFIGIAELICVMVAGDLFGPRHMNGYTGTGSRLGMSDMFGPSSPPVMGKKCLTFVMIRDLSCGISPRLLVTGTCDGVLDATLTALLSQVASELDPASSPWTPSTPVSWAVVVGVAFRIRWAEGVAVVVVR